MSNDATRLHKVSEVDELYQEFSAFSAWRAYWSASYDDDLHFWDRFAAALEQKRSTATPAVLKSAVEVALRAAAIDTGAIEGLYTVDRGFTMSVATQALAWQHEIGEKGQKVREYFEAQLASYELIIDAATEKLPVSEAWIRALHENLCAPQETYKVNTPQGVQEHQFVKGEYKRLPNHVVLGDGRFHAYAPVDRVPAEMHRLIDEMSQPDFQEAHPVLQASYSHYALVNVHPFSDGNGRVARALASMFLYRSHSIPLLVFANQKPSYLEALRFADAGKFSSLFRFIRDRGIDTMQLVSEQLDTAGEGVKKAQIDAIAALNHYDAPVDDIAVRLRSELRERLHSSFERLQSPPSITLRDKDTHPNLIMDIPKGYRRSDLAPTLTFTLHSAQPASAGEVIYIRILIAVDSSSPFTFLLERFGSNDQLQVRLEDVNPELSASFLHRLDNWLSRQLGRSLVTLEARAKKSLERLMT